MIKQFVNGNQQFGADRVAASAAMLAAAVPHRDAATKVLNLAMRALNVSLPRTTVTSKMRNSLDGEITFDVSGFLQNWPIMFQAVSKIENGKSVFSEKIVADAVEAALKAAKEAPATPATLEAGKLELDLQQIVAIRSGHVVSFSTPELPSWSLHVKAEELLNENSRKFVPGRVVASLRGFCLTEFRRVAAFKQEDFKLPMIQASVQAKVVAAPLPQWQVPVQAVPQQADQSLHNISAGMTSPLISEDPNLSLIASNDNRRMFESHIRSMAEPAAINYVRTALKGGAPVVKTTDMTSLAYDKNRLLTGAAVVNVKFYGKMGVEEASIAVPFDRSGRPDVKAINRTQADLAAEEQRVAALKLKSDEEAKRAFDEFVASEKAKKARIEGMGVKASVGYGGARPLPNFLIPIPKVSIPEEYSVAGKRIVVDGMIYEVEPTNHNSPDVEHSTFWMLRLKPELGIKDADYAPNYSGVTAALATASR